MVYNKTDIIAGAPAGHGLYVCLTVATDRLAVNKAAILLLPTLFSCLFPQKHVFETSLGETRLGHMLWERKFPLCWVLGEWDTVIFLSKQPYLNSSVTGRALMWADTGRALASGPGS